MGKRISQLDLATPLTGAEQFVLVQNSRTKRTTLDTIREEVDSSCQCTLVNRFAQVGNAANVLQQYVQTYQMPGNTLLSAGYWLEIYASGEFAANNDLKLVTIYFGSSSFGITTTGADGNSKGWDFRVRVHRMTQTTQQMTGTFLTFPRSSFAAGTGTIFPKGNPTENLSNVVSIRLSVQTDQTTANNILVNDFIIRVNKMDADS